MSEKRKIKTETLIHELKDAVKDIFEQDENLQEELYLLRFLKARQMNVKKAEKMLRESTTWRKEKNVKGLVESDLHPEIIHKLPVLKGRLRNGSYFALVSIGKTDFKGLIAQYGIETGLQFVLQHAVKDEAQNIAWNRVRFHESKAEDIHPSSITGNGFFVDLKDISWEQILSMSNWSLVVQLLRDYIRYLPVLGAICVVINCPNYAVRFVNILKKMAERPDLKIEVYGTNKSEWQPAVLKYVAPEEVPPCFGGTKNVPGFS